MNKISPFLSLIFGFILSACAAVSPCTHATSMTDVDITTAVQVQLAHDTGLADQAITVTTFERTVTLTGHVQNFTQADIAVMLARSVPNVRCVISKLKIVPVKP